MSTDSEALAHFRTALGAIAPEIPDDDVHPGAHLTNDLRLDTVSIWAVAVSMERWAKVSFPDEAIGAAETVEDLLALALPDAV